MGVVVWRVGFLERAIDGRRWLNGCDPLASQCKVTGTVTVTGTKTVVMTMLSVKLSRLRLFVSDLRRSQERIEMQHVYDTYDGCSEVLQICSDIMTIPRHHLHVSDGTSTYRW
jgi:hypothetical protein